MNVTLWGTRGSLAAAGPDTVQFGGDTSSVEVRATDGTAVLLDAGSGIRRLGKLVAGQPRVDVLLTHLHMDHIQGLGFFEPVYSKDVEVHIWGPGSSDAPLEQRLARYLSPPLFPVRIRELQNVVIHDLEPGRIEIGPLTVHADYVTHPGVTFGFRITEGSGSLAYLPDHEPVLGGQSLTNSEDWVSGFELMRDVDVLIHDTQYTEDEYDAHRGWGHSSYDQAVLLANRAGVGSLVSFHHDPGHDDQLLNSLSDRVFSGDHGFTFVPGRQGTSIEIDV